MSKPRIYFWVSLSPLVSYAIQALFELVLFELGSPGLFYPESPLWLIIFWPVSVMFAFYIVMFLLGLWMIVRFRSSRQDLVYILAGESLNILQILWWLGASMGLR